MALAPTASFSTASFSTASFSTASFSTTMAAAVVKLVASDHAVSVLVGALRHHAGLGGEFVQIDESVLVPVGAGKSFGGIVRAVAIFASAIRLAVRRALRALRCMGGAPGLCVGGEFLARQAAVVVQIGFGKAGAQSGVHFRTGHLAIGVQVHLAQGGRAGSRRLLGEGGGAKGHDGGGGQDQGITEHCVLVLGLSSCRSGDRTGLTTRLSRIDAGLRENGRGRRQGAAVATACYIFAVHDGADAIGWRWKGQGMDQEAPHLLIVEDARDIREPLARYLKEAGYRVSAADSAAAARKLLKTNAFDLVLTDIMMPGEDGLSLARHIRETSGAPLIFLTARGEEVDRVVGLELGADDYVVKPFYPREVLARIAAVLRRAVAPPPAANTQAGGYRFDRWRVDAGQRELIGSDGVAQALSTGEFRLLTAFLERPRITLTREQLLDLARGRDAEAFDRAIDNAIVRLRKKIEEDPKNPRLIKTVWGGGYVFAADVEKE